VREAGTGGCERDLTKLALGIDRNRFHPHVAYFQEGFRLPELREAGIPLLDLGVNSFRNFSALAGARRLWRYVRRNNIILSHAYDVPASIYTAPLARLCGVPHVITSALGFRELYSARERRMLRWTDRFADHIVVNSQAVFDEMVTREGIRREKLFLCRNGFAPEVFYPRRENSVPPAALPGGEVVVGVVAALRPEKNIGLLLQAARRLRDLPFRLLILGSGPEEERLRQMAAELDLAGRIQFEPGRPDVAQWFRFIDIFVLSSVSESFPNVVLEAMASGCAVIASAVGGVPELVRDQDTGLLFESNSAEALAAGLRRLLLDSGLRAELGAKAAEWALKNLPMTVYCRTMERFYLDQIEVAPASQTGPP
jgi:glycosyltransferase involved in cell wall biosynthesis